MTSKSAIQATGTLMMPSFSGSLRWKILANRRRPVWPTFTNEMPYSEKSHPIRRASVGSRIFSPSPSTMTTAPGLAPPVAVAKKLTVSPGKTGVVASTS